ncbi:MAG: hypothetical protein HKM22_05845 [Gammaproteobacteria bacterium]|nr:hypothetical protein [Gammaproteobacteria bacterium]
MEKGTDPFNFFNLKGSIVDRMIGKKFMISGMVIEIISDDNETWETRNITTKETVFFNKSVLEGAIKLGKAEEISGLDDKE